MKINKPLKIALYCVILFLFIAGSIVVVEQIKFGLNTNTTVTQNRQLNHSTNPVYLLSGQAIITSDDLMNISDLNAPVIKSGNITLSNTSTQGMARINAMRDAEWYLRQALNIPNDEILRMVCNAAGECSYKVTKPVKITAALFVVPTYDHWDESAYYYVSGGTNFYSGYWKVPSSSTGPTEKTMFLFVDLENESQTVCELSVNRVLSSEVILNTGEPLVGWNYSKVETITGTTAGAQTNYQMKLTLYNSTGTDTPGNIYLGGNVRSDFGDIRFTKSDGVTLLDYWIESYTPGISAVVWVKVDSIPASPGTANIYLYYGNPSATSASNGNATFVFFDDFEDGAYTNNPTWSVEAGIFSVQNETLDGKTSKRLYSSSQGSTIKSPSTLAQNAAWEWDSYNQGRDGYGNALQQGRIYFIYLDDNNYAFAGNYEGYIIIFVIGGNTVVRSDSGSNTIATGILHYKVTRVGNTWTFYVNDIQKYQGNVSGLTSSALTKYSVSASAGDSASYPNRIDNFRYRNYTYPEPTWG